MNLPSTSTDLNSSTANTALNADISGMSDAQARLFAEISARQNAVEHKDDLVERQGYRVGKLNILAKFDASSELLVMPSIYRLPGAPDGVKGLANLHGNVVPVFELARWFNVSHDLNTTQMLLVLGHGDEAVAVIIDGLPVRKRFSPNDAVSIDSGHPRMARFATAAYRDQTDLANPNTVWMEFDHQRFFDTFARRFAVK
jgi:chemotaxis signal transduction protein